MPLYKRRLPGQPSADAGDIAGLMGPLALGGAMGKAVKLSWDDIAELNDLLGKPMQVGKRLLRLSSGNPAQNRAIVHTSEGERIATPIDEFLKLIRSEGLPPAEDFPEGAVVTARGVPAPAKVIGPKGGMNPPKRRLK